MPLTRLIVAVAISTIFQPAMVAQSYDPVLETGIAPFQSYAGGNVDTVNLATGNLSLRIPLVSFPQRGGVLHANFLIAYNGNANISVYCPIVNHCEWVYSGTFGYVGGSLYVGIKPQVADAAPPLDGTTHLMGWTSINGSTSQQRSVDGSGLLATTVVNPDLSVAQTVVDRNGVTYYCPGNSNFSTNPCTLTDSNGNQITYNECCGPSGFTDTMGRQIPTPPSPGANWVVPGPNGANATYQISANGVTLPDSQAYSFQYTTVALPLLNGQGTAQTTTVLSKVTFPSGGSISYGYPTSYFIASICNNSNNNHAPVISRSVDANDGTGPHTWTYDYNTATNVTTVTDPLGNQSAHTFTPSVCFPYESQNKQTDSQGNVLKTVTTQYSSITDQNAVHFGPLDVLPTAITTVWPNGKHTTVSMTYDNNHGSTFRFGMTTNQSGTAIIYASQQSGYTDNPWTASETDYTGTVLRTTNTNYKAFSSSTYFGENLLDLVSSIQITDGGAAQKAYSTFGYDESSLQSSGVTVQKIAGESYPGNQTSVHRWLSNGNATAQSPCNVSVASGGYLVTSKTYFDTGEISQTTDPCLYSTSYLYSSTYDGSYATTLTNAQGRSTTIGYDFNTGRVTSTTDPNLQPTTKTYDIMGRPTRVAYPDGGSTSYCYTDVGGATCTQANSPPFAAVTTKAITSGLNETSTVVFDGLGRISQSQLNSDSPSTTYTQITYDALGRKSQGYNPTRCNPPTTNCGETTWGYTTYNYDGINRVTSVVKQDGSTVSTNYAAFPCTTVTDETGKSRQSCLDGLDRLTGVWEDPGSSPHLNYETDYSYSTLGDLTNVTQKGSNGANARTRSFAYDSLSRLTSASNPESGTISYGYDADGNVITKRAPSPNQPSTGTATATTTFTYDTLNRLKTKTYTDTYASNPTMASVSFGYDGVALSGCTTNPPADTDSFPVGRRTSMCDGSGASSWKHDKMGRVLQERRTIGTVVGDYDTDAYNLDGSVSSVTSLGYGVAYTYNGAARPLTATHSSTKFVQSATYAPPGELVGMTIGAATGFGGIITNNAYNDRLQPILFSAGVSGQNPVFSLCYDFHLHIAVTGPTPCSFSASTAGDNGNVYQIVNNGDNTRTQNFIYDSLNRIQQAYSSGTQWGETFGPTATSPGVAPSTSGIDSWGNLTNRSGVIGKTNLEPLSVSASTHNQLSGFGYDAAGNMTSNGSTSYFYDAENRLIATAGYSYVYDGDGRRVEKCTEGSTPGTCVNGATGTLYWKGTASAPVTETDLAGNVQNAYILFNGQRVARSDSGGVIHYYFSDHLGSHGVVENATGSACEQDIDYYPYGGVENNYCTIIAQNYKFTGKERDSESGLDNFMKRYHASTMGRFMTPDPLVIQRLPANPFLAHLSNPQAWNKYAYVMNNPLSLTDPTGLDFYLLCSGRDTTTCQGSHVGTTDDKGKFRATVITSASLQDPKSGVTGTVTEGGVKITTASGTYTGQFINGTPAATLQGSGALSNFSFNITGQNPGNLLRGTWQFNGTPAQAAQWMQSHGAWSYPLDVVNPFHPNTQQFRFSDPNDSSGPSIHISQPLGSGLGIVNGFQIGVVTFPSESQGEFHVDTHGTTMGHIQDVIDVLTR